MGGGGETAPCITTLQHHPWVQRGVPTLPRKQQFFLSRMSEAGTQHVSGNAKTVCWMKAGVYLKRVSILLRRFSFLKILALWPWFPYFQPIIKEKAIKKWREKWLIYLSTKHNVLSLYFGSLKIIHSTQRYDAYMQKHEE